MIAIKSCFIALFVFVLTFEGYCQTTDLYVDLDNPTHRISRNTSDSIIGYAESGGIAWLNYGIYTDHFFKGEFPVSFFWNARTDNGLTPIQMVSKRDLKKMKLVSVAYFMEILGKLGLDYYKSYRIFFVEPYKKKKFKVVNVQLMGDLSNDDVFRP